MIFGQAAAQIEAFGFKSATTPMDTDPAASSGFVLTLHPVNVTLFGKMIEVVEGAVKADPPPSKEAWADHNPRVVVSIDKAVSFA